MTAFLLTKTGDGDYVFQFLYNISFFEGLTTKKKKKRPMFFKKNVFLAQGWLVGLDTTYFAEN